METCFNYFEKDTAFFSSDEKRWINKIHKLKKQYPDRVTILAEPEQNDGCIYCKLPSSALKLQLSRKLTEEERLTATERLRLAREKALDEKH